MEQNNLHRFRRLELLIGPEGSAALDRARVAVVGLGGVGSFAVEALARAGVGWLVLIDHDDICLSNTNRQLHALEGNYGRPKVEVMEERVKAINPQAAVVAWRQFLTAENAPDLLRGGLSYVVDAIDTVAAKAALIQHCVENGIPIVSVMGAGNKFDPLAFRVDDISRTHTCPLAKAVRKALREKGIERGVKAVYSTEKPAQPLAEAPACPGECACPGRGERDCPRRRSIPGSTSYVPPIAGLIAAGVVIGELLRTERG